MATENENKILFELVSPDRLLTSDSVEMVVVPGTEGYFGVLPGHAPTVSSLQPGVLDIYDHGQVSERLFVAGGFVEVNAERCTVLAREVVPFADFVAAKADYGVQASNLREDVARVGDPQQKARLQKDLELAEAKIRIAEDFAK